MRCRRLYGAGATRRRTFQSDLQYDPASSRGAADGLGAATAWRPARHHGCETSVGPSGETAVAVQYLADEANNVRQPVRTTLEGACRIDRAFYYERIPLRLVLHLLRDEAAEARRAIKPPFEMNSVCRLPASFSGCRWAAECQRSGDERTIAGRREPGGLDALRKSNRRMCYERPDTGPSWPYTRRARTLAA